MTGHLRGEFEHMLRGAQEARSLEEELLALVEDLPEGGATMEVFQTRTQKARHTIAGALDALRQAGLIKHQHGKARGGHYVIVKETTEAEHDQ